MWRGQFIIYLAFSICCLEAQPGGLVHREIEIISLPITLKGLGMRYRSSDRKAQGAEKINSKRNREFKRPCYKQEFQQLKEQILMLPPNELAHDLQNQMETQKELNFDDLIRELEADFPLETTEISVENIDTVDAAEKLLNGGFNPVIVNFANRWRPCGGVELGASAQEEEICRKTSLWRYLARQSPVGLKVTRYNIPEHGVLYTPYVHLLNKRDTNGHLYLLPTPYNTIGVISSAAYDMRTRTAGGPRRLDTTWQKYQSGTQKKVEAQLMAGIINHHDAIVLGAFGCGAFKGDKSKTIEAQKEAIKKYGKHYKRIVFAVLTTDPILFNEYQTAFDKKSLNDLAK